MLGLRTTIYKVSDIQKATEWYSNAFETNPYYNEPYYVGFNIKGYELGLQPEDNPTFDKVESVVSYWGVENIQATFDRLIELGATENEKPYSVGGDLELVRDFGFGLQPANFVSLFVKIFALGTRLGLQILPQLK